MKKIILGLVLISSFVFGTDYSKKQIGEYIVEKIINDNTWDNNVKFKDNDCTIASYYTNSDVTNEHSISLINTQIVKDTSGSLNSITILCNKNKKCSHSKDTSHSKNLNDEINHYDYLGIYTSKDNYRLNKVYKALNDLSLKCNQKKELY